MASDDEHSGDENPMLARHRKEKKELRVKTQALKKAAKSGNKQAQKEAKAECDKLEKDLEEKQKKELAEQQELKTDETPPVEAEKKKEESEPVDKWDEAFEEAANSFYKATKISVKQAKKQAKKKEQSERMAAAAKADKLVMESGETEKIAEQVELSRMLAEKNLKMVNIPGDGDCLYNAIRYQCHALGLTALTTEDVRHDAYEYMQKNPEQFQNFVCYDDANEDVSGDTQWEKYLKSVQNMACDKGAWGGEPELTAISRSYRKTIEIYHTGGMQVIGEEFYDDPVGIIQIAFLQRAYSLGAHYNATEPKK